MADKWEASHRFARITPMKARLVINQIRGKYVDEAKELLVYSRKRAAYFIDRVLQSAVANATRQPGVDPTRLVIAEAYVNDAPRFKRFKAGPMGRARRIIKRNAHIHVVVEQRDK